LTCIVAIVKKGVIYIGADSLGSTDNGYATVRKDEKVFINREYIIGYCGSFRMGQLLKYSRLPIIPTEFKGENLHRFMCTVFINHVRDIFKVAGHSEIKDNVEEGGNFIVGVNGELFEIECDFQVGKSLDNFMSIGSGSPYALGSLYSTKSEEPEMRIHLALKAAERYNAFVRGPFKVVIKEK
jgi:ATP-dependent protease HslVU (ClpYQ) peptidase subunit